MSRKEEEKQKKAKKQPSLGKTRVMTTEEWFLSGLGERMKAVRKAAGIRQWQIAEACGLTQHAWSQFEHGTRLPSATALLTLCLSTNTRMDYLFGQTDRYRDSVFSILDLEEALSALAVFSDIKISARGNKITLDVGDSEDAKDIIEMAQRVVQMQKGTKDVIKNGVSLEELEAHYRNLQHAEHRNESVYKMIAGDGIYNKNLPPVKTKKKPSERTKQEPQEEFEGYPLYFSKDDKKETP